MFAKLSDIFLKIMIIIITFKSFELAFMIQRNLSVNNGSPWARHRKLPRRLDANIFSYLWNESISRDLFQMLACSQILYFPSPVVNSTV